MHSCLNDFVIIDGRDGGCDYRAVQKAVTKIAARDGGIGCDQILIITDSEKADCGMIVYNADGSEAGMCANGLRCVGRLMAEENNKDENTIEIAGVVYKTRRKGSTAIAVALGKPRFGWQEIPLARAMAGPELDYSWGSFSKPIVVNVGNPHAIFFVEQELEEIKLPKVGSEIERDPLFPERINVSFVKRIDKNSLAVRTWERGAGETGSCGSAATAIAWAGVFCGQVEAPVRICYGPDRIITVELLEDGALESSAEACMIHAIKSIELA
jgi:diaminopimelate epimerase